MGKHLPDLEHEKVVPHPDGLAWRKACGVCLHRIHDPQEVGCAYQQRLMRYDGDAVFYCLHRKDGEFDRVCACYAAANRLPQVARPSPRGGE